MDLYTLRLTPGLLGFWGLGSLCFVLFNEVDK